MPAENEVNFGEHKSSGTSNQSLKSQPVFSDYDAHFNTNYPNFRDICKRIESVNRTDSITNQDGPSNSKNMQQSEIRTDVISKMLQTFILLLIDTIFFVIIGDEDWEDGIMAQVLAESRKTYLDDLKRNSKKRHGSPGPSTSR